MANPMALNYANDTIPGDNPSGGLRNGVSDVYVPAGNHSAGAADVPVELSHYRRKLNLIIEYIS